MNEDTKAKIAKIAKGIGWCAIVVALFVPAVILILREIAAGKKKVELKPRFRLVDVEDADPLDHGDDAAKADRAGNIDAINKATDDALERWR